jgi:hypothetical protein
MRYVVDRNVVMRRMTVLSRHVWGEGGNIAHTFLNWALDRLVVVAYRGQFPYHEMPSMPTNRKLDGSYHEMPSVPTNRTLDGSHHEMPSVPTNRKLDGSNSPAGGLEKTALTLPPPDASLGQSVHKAHLAVGQLSHDVTRPNCSHMYEYMALRYREGKTWGPVAVH